MTDRNRTQIEAEAQSFLQSHPLGVLSTLSADKKPWGSAIYCHVDELFNFYFTTRTSTAKHQNLTNHAAAALTFVDAKSQQTVQGAGQVDEAAPKDVQRVLDTLGQVRSESSDHNWLPPVIKLKSGELIFYKLTPNFLQYSNFNRDTTGGGGYTEQIIPA